MPRVVVVGAGVAGLSCAIHLRELDPGVELSVLEASSRAGGLVRSECTDGWVIERGPESILTDKPAAVRMAERLGIASSIVRTRPEHRGAYVVAHGRLERIPEGFQLLAPLDLAAFMRADYISLPGRVRALLDLVIPGHPHDDETLASFVRRRFGQELLDRLAQPLVGGIYGADPESLGLAATMPRFLAAEREHGSVIRGLRANLAGAPAQGARYGLFINFDRGMQTLTDAMAASVRELLRFETRVASIERDGNGFRLSLDDGSEERCDALVIAVGGVKTAELLHGVDASLSAEVGSIRHGSGAIVTLAYPTERIGHPLDTYGYVSPFVEGRRILASTFLSRKWPGRAPEGNELLRFFFGRDGDDAVVELPDAELVAAARAEAEDLLAARGEPLFTRVDRWRKAMPRFELHHLDRVASIEANVARIPGLALAGNACRGVGIPDSIVSGETAAERALAHLRGV